MKNQIQIPSENEYSSDGGIKAPYRKLGDPEDQKKEENLSAFSKLFKEIKSTLKLEDWLATYLGCFGSFIIIVIYLANPQENTISLDVWDNNPLDAFNNGSYYILFIFVYAILSVWVTFFFLS